MDEVDQALANNDIPQFISLCEELELENALNQLEKPIINPHLFAYLFLAYFITHDFHSARYLYKRYPTHSNQNYLTLLKSWHKGDYFVFFETVKNLQTRENSPQIKKLLELLSSQTKEWVATSMEKFYDSIEIVQGKEWLGLDSVEQAKDIFTQRSWTVSEDGAFFVNSRDANAVDELDKDTTDALEKFRKLMDYVVHLEVEK